MTTDQIKQLYRQCFPEVAAYILKNSGTQADAEDAFQKALYGVLRRSADLPPIEDMAGYLFRASRNNFLKAINGSRPPSPATDTEGEKDDTADDDEQPDGERLHRRRGDGVVQRRRLLQRHLQGTTPDVVRQGAGFRSPVRRAVQGADLLRANHRQPGSP
ncbi:MAG TPA: hypothetical protein PK858_12660 [Saprospiraceae bacterium]|nr:hypothetical protein [Saprospiraceae bacterium]